MFTVTVEITAYMQHVNRARLQGFRPMRLKQFLAITNKMGIVFGCNPIIKTAG